MEVAGCNAVRHGAVLVDDRDVDVDNLPDEIVNPCGSPIADLMRRRKKGPTSV